MAKINLLDPAVSELIAAGEVIERPSSIVKELLENSIDAGASAVTVEIKNGGISFLRVTDNGCGMEREDVPTAFLRHATSKVAVRKDLDAIHTLGFRGEALASIAAVTHLELMTKTADASVGTRAVLHGGAMEECFDVGCPNGTTFVIRDLFYNVPARLKFLKKGVTEGIAVQTVVEKIALSHPEVSIKLLRDNKPVLHTPGDGKLLSAIHAVLGREFAHALLEVEYEYQGIRVNGYTIQSEQCRKNRTLQNFFVNHRFVRSKTCMAALEEAYTNAKMAGRFPACVLNLTLPADQVDVNVHPAKIEVRFMQEKSVYDTVYFAVKSALTRADTLTTDLHEKQTIVSRPILPVKEQHAVQQQFASPAKPKETTFRTMTAEEYRKQYAPREPVFTETIVPKPNKPIAENSKTQSPIIKLRQDRNPPEPPPAPKPADDPFSFLDVTSFAKREEAPKCAPQPVAEVPPQTMIVTPKKGEKPVHIRMIGELFKTYILFEANEQFVMIDKHAAHERILFERLKTAVSLKESQVLLTPLTLTLSSEERGVLLENADRLAELGFRFTEQNGQFALAEAPLLLHRFDLEDIVCDLAEQLAAGRVSLMPERLEELLHSMACRAAIKANDHQSMEELTALVREVYADDRIRHCPHGRPVGVTMSRYEIEGKFGRHG